MKTLGRLALATAGLLAAVLLHGQHCLPDGIIFNTQESIDSFPMNYPDCKQIIGTVQIHGTGISNLDSLSQVKDIVGSLNIFDNPALTGLNGLHNLMSVGGDLIFSTNPLLSGCQGLNALHSVGGNLLINYSQFSSLSGLDSLISIGGNLEITVSDLTSLEGLGSLEFVDGNIFLYGLQNLGSLEDLSALRMINGSLAIQYCGTLQSLSGIDSLITDKLTKLIITDNAMLKSCAVYSVCRYLDFTGNVTEIANNMEGCDNVEEVQAECDLTALPDPEANATLECFPNPTTGRIHIRFPGHPPAGGVLIVADLTGRILLKRPFLQPETDLSHLEGGIYLVSIVASRQTWSGRVMVGGSR